MSDSERVYGTSVILHYTDGETGEVFDSSPVSDVLVRIETALTREQDWLLLRHDPLNQTVWVRMSEIALISVTPKVLVDASAQVKSRKD